MAAVFGFMAQDGFGEYRPVRELAGDVVFREGIAPKAYRRGGLRRVLDSAAMSWQVTCAQLPALAPWCLAARAAMRPATT
jgi:hypothetical protein